MERDIQLEINGRPVTMFTDEERPLLEVLREELSLTGTKYACGEGQCGACTVLAGDDAIRSCITPVGDVSGESIRTIEGLASGANLHPVQQAFIDNHAMQCGYCVPGQIMSAVALLRRQPELSEQEIIREMDANICRCCNYINILNAVKQAAKGMPDHVER